MTTTSAIADHHRVCDELFQLAGEENRFLRQHQRVPDNTFLNRKRELLEKLEQTLEALRAIPAASARDADTRAQLENARARILQILQLDKENEQLLLRYSLAGGRATATPVAASSTSMLQKIYARCA